MPKTHHTMPLDALLIPKLKRRLEELGFEFFDKQYAYFTAKKNKLNITVYEKGPKVFIQGKDTEDFIKFTLEPEIIERVILGQEEELNPEMFEPHFGIDESGKGDFFGPLVTAGVYVDKEMAKKLLEIGVADSKKLTDKKIHELAKKMFAIQGLHYDVITLTPLKYNALYGKFNNLNKMLAWAHAKITSNLLKKVPDCPRAFSDQFAKSHVLETALKQQGIDLEVFNLQQETKGERDVAVAAASVLARHFFVDWLARASERGGVTLPKGAGTPVVQAAELCRDKFEPNIFDNLVKKHFTIYKKLTR